MMDEHEVFSPFVVVFQVKSLTLHHLIRSKGMMKSVKAYWLVCLSLVLLMACGEDRTYEYEEKTQHNHWIREQMIDQYLWADSLVDFEPAWKDFFSEPAAFLATLSKKSRADDYWSYVGVDTIVADAHARGYFNHLNSYGFDFILMKDPTGQTTRQMLRVATVSNLKSRDSLTL